MTLSPASSRESGGGGGGGDVVLYDETLASAAASFDTTGIDLSGYTHLRVVAKTRATDADNPMRMRFNNHSGADYGWNNDISSASPQTFMVCGYGTGSGDAATEWGVSYIDIPFYENTSMNKVLQFQNVTRTGGLMYFIIGMGFFFQQTNLPVSRIQLVAGVTWDVGSRMIVYGVQPTA